MEREQSSDSPPAPATSRPKPLDWPQFAGTSDAVARGIDAYVRRRRRRRMATVASVAAVVLMAGFVWRTAGVRSDEPLAPALAAAGAPVARATTVVSRPSRQTLPDGSEVELKAGAEIAVDFAAGQSGVRLVRLVRGEAHFTVVKNPERPFVVAAGGVDVRAVGTAFSVQWGGGEVDVLVTAGRVALDATARTPVAAGALPSAGSEPTENDRAQVEAGGTEMREPLAFVDAGSRAIVATTAGASLTPRVEIVTATEMGERLAWRVPRLEFSATPLVEVVAMFNRHAVPQAGAPTTRLTLAEEELGALPLSGMLRVDNVTVLLQIMESSYGIAAEQRGNGEIVLRKGK